ncbi:MAG: MFS transporter [Vicinamibacterales bacterium]
MRAPLLERLGMHRRELRAWILYDWANSAFMTTVIAAVFPIYYASVAAAGQPADVAASRFAWATTGALAFVAVLAPILGAMADRAPIKKSLLFLFQSIGVLATLAMFFIHRGDASLALWLFVLGNVGVSGAFTFYDSLLPHVARPQELDRVSTSGYAMGYFGGGLLLAINLAWIQQPQWFGFSDAGVATRVSFVSVGLWWLLFSIPLFRRVPEPAIPNRLPQMKPATLLRDAFGQLGDTFRELSRYRDATLMLVAFLVYNDGINTIIRMASLYGTQIGIEQQHLIAALLIVQFVGVPFAFLFGRVADRMGAKRAIFVSLAVYAVISLLGYYMTSAIHFYLLAVLVGTVQGGSQALSRSLFAAMIPRQKSSEFFGFFAVFEKFAGIVGPLVFAWVISQTGSSRQAVLAVMAFFVVGAILLARVDVEAGRRAARAAEHESLA